MLPINCGTATREGGVGARGVYDKHTEMLYTDIYCKTAIGSIGGFETAMMRMDDEAKGQKAKANAEAARLAECAHSLE